MLCRFFAGVFFCALAFACAGGGDVGDGVDAGAAADARWRNDANDLDDSGTPADSGAQDDASGGGDAGGVFDGAETGDTGGPTDSGTDGDEGLPEDSGSTEDAGQTADTGVAVDSGHDTGFDAGRDAGAFQPGDHAVVASHTLPAGLSCNQKISVTVTMRNMGDTTWTAAGNYRLGAATGNALLWSGAANGGYYNAVDNQRLFLGADVQPGGVATFTFDVTAPDTPATYRFAAQMVRDGVHWFGEIASSAVSVTCQGPRVATLADLFDGTAHFVTDQDPVPLAHEQAGHRELFAVNRTDVGPRTVYAYHRIFDRGGNVSIGLSVSTNGGDSYDDYRGEVVTYDPGHIFSTAATVAKQGNRWLMAYEESHVATTHWAESADGLSWTKKGKLLSHSSSGWDSIACVTPGIFVDADTTIYVFYAGMPDGGVNMDVGFASGKVMGALTKSPTNPVLRRPPSGWSVGQVSMPRIVRQGDYYYAIYEGATLDYTCDVKNRYGWGVARSKDLVNWEPYVGNPIAQSAQQGVGCGNDMPQPFIRYDNEVFVYHTSADTRRIVRDHLVMK